MFNWVLNTRLGFIMFAKEKIPEIWAIPLQWFFHILFLKNGIWGEVRESDRRRVNHLNINHISMVKSFKLNGGKLGNPPFKTNPPGKIIPPYTIYIFTAQEIKFSITQFFIFLCSDSSFQMGYQTLISNLILINNLFDYSSSIR